MPRGYGFDESSMQRIGDAVRAVEGWPTDERDQRRARGPVGQGAALQWIQCQDEADADDRYPAVWVQYDEATDTWTEMADCYLRTGPNGEIPIVDKRYLARCQGVHPDDGLPVYVPVVFPGGFLIGGGPSSGATYTSGALTAMALNYAYQDGAFWSNANPTRLYAVADGLYRVDVIARLSSTGVANTYWWIGDGTNDLAGGEAIGNPVLNFSRFFAMTAGQYFEAAAKQATGVDQTIRLTGINMQYLGADETSLTT